MPADMTGLPTGASSGPPDDRQSADSSGATGASSSPPDDRQSADSAGATHDASTGATSGATIAKEPSPTSSHSGPLRVGQAFGSRYRILKLLGAGGMGAVYQAWDAELSVAVALKVIRHSSRSPEVERQFKNELLLARSVTHKNVVRIHDLGEMNGMKFITMSYVEGHDLSTLLRRAGACGIPKALKLARQIAAGLTAAHDAGVVHRDLKPANVMIGADDLALIMDFGISASATEDTSGDFVGTLEYMAPEQAERKLVDGRADIYALGLILYELLTGPRLVAGAAASNRLEAMKFRTTEGLPAPRTQDPSIPEALDALVMRCVERDPAGRFQSSAELCAALDKLDDNGEPIPEPTKVTRRMLVAAAVVVATLAGATYVAGRRMAPAAPTKHPTVSVLIADFDNRTGESALDGPLGAEALSIALEGAPYVSLYPARDARTLARQLSSDHAERLTGETSRLIARREGINVLLEGSIERRGSSGYRVAARVIDPATGGTVASENANAADRPHVLNAISTLAERVRLALGESKTEMAKVAAAETFTASSLEAMQAYARAQDLMNGGKLQDAIAAYQEAVARDPQLGRAYSGMASIYRNLGQMDQAEASFKEALKHVDRMSEREKYRTLGVYNVGIARNYPKAVEIYEELIARYPADRASLNNLAFAYVQLRNFTRAEAVMQQLVQLYPNYILGRTNHATYALYAGNFDVAIAEATEALKQNPTYQFAFLPLALAQLSKADLAAGLETYSRFGKLNAFGASLSKLGAADASMYRGQYADVPKQLLPAIADDERNGEKAAAAKKHVALADAYVALNRRDAALAAARRAAAIGQDESVLFPAAMTLMWGGRHEEARAIGDKLKGMLENAPRSYATLIAAEVARRQQQLPDALDAIRDAQKRHDSWWSRFLLGRLYEEMGHHPEAVAELELAVKRRGEAADAFIADTPMLRYVPPAYYWLARAQEGMQAAPAARRSYDQFIALRGQGDTADPLLADARTRAAALPR
jgi:tetratricopeptide (TPR) repeat protein